MRKQDLLIVSISTIAAGAVTALAGVAQPLALIGASTLGAMGGSLLVSKSELVGTGGDRQRLQRRLQGLQDQLNEIELSPRRRPAKLPEHSPQRREPTYDSELSYGRSPTSPPETNLGDHAELTAIFYDIENLLKGYRFSQEFIENISLTAIFQNIQNNESVGMIATQKAYANWSDPRLKVLRNEINELGIDPIQIFGFAQDPTKNAADIQLVIDAVSLTYTNPAIKTVAIISGDGGFASLVKQLREQGKRVIGCAYHDSTSRTFQAVCDDFISLELPTKSKGDRPHSPPHPAATKNPKPPRTPKVIITPNGLRLTDPVLIDYAQTYQPDADLTTRSQMIEAANEILAFFSQHPLARKTLQGSGLNISLFSQAMKYRVEGFNYLKLGFSRLVDFISSLTEVGEIQLVHRPPSEYRLLLKTATLPDYQTVTPSGGEPEVHTRDYYLKLLAKAPPLFKLPAPAVTLQILHCLVAHPDAYQHQLLAAIVARVQADLAAGSLGLGSDRTPTLGESTALAPVHLAADPDRPCDNPHPATEQSNGQCITSAISAEVAAEIAAEIANPEPAQPVSIDPTHATIALPEPANLVSMHSDSMHSDSMHSDSMYSEPGHSEPGHSEPGHSEPGNSEPNSENVLNQARHDDALDQDDALDDDDSFGDVDASFPADGIDRTTIQNAILALVMSGCFVRKPQPEANDSSRLAEQTLSLNVPSVGAAIALLRGAVHTKLSSLLEDVNENVLNEIVPFLPDES